MQDRPTKIELLRGVEYFLTDEAVEMLEGPAKFHARVAARAVRMVIAELDIEEDDLRQEYEGLRKILDDDAAEPVRLDDLQARLLEMNEELCKRIRGGGFAEGQSRKELLNHLNGVAVRKLSVNNPKMTELVREELGVE